MYSESIQNQFFPLDRKIRGKEREEGGRKDRNKRTAPVSFQRFRSSTRSRFEERAAGLNKTRSKSTRAPTPQRSSSARIERNFDAVHSRACTAARIKTCQRVEFDLACFFNADNLCDRANALDSSCSYSFFRIPDAKDFEIESRSYIVGQKKKKKEREKRIENKYRETN